MHQRVHVHKHTQGYSKILTISHRLLGTFHSGSTRCPSFWSMPPQTCRNIIGEEVYAREMTAALLSLSREREMGEGSVSNRTLSLVLNSAAPTLHATKMNTSSRKLIHLHKLPACLLPSLSPSGILNPCCRRGCCGGDSEGCNICSLILAVAHGSQFQYFTVKLGYGKLVSTTLRLPSVSRMRRFGNSKSRRFKAYEFELRE